MQFECPKPDCRTRYSVRVEVGQRVRCARCGHVWQVSESDFVAHPSEESQAVTAVTGEDAESMAANMGEAKTAREDGSPNHNPAVQSEYEEYTSAPPADPENWREPYGRQAASPGRDDVAELGHAGLRPEENAAVRLATAEADMAGGAGWATTTEETSEEEGRQDDWEADSNALEGPIFERAALEEIIQTVEAEGSRRQKRPQGNKAEFPEPEQLAAGRDSEDGNSATETDLKTEKVSDNAESDYAQHHYETALTSGTAEIGSNGARSGIYDEDDPEQETKRDLELERALMQGMEYQPDEEGAMRYVSGKNHAQETAHAGEENAFGSHIPPSALRNGAVGDENRQYYGHAGGEEQSAGGPGLARDAEEGSESLRSYAGTFDEFEAERTDSLFNEPETALEGFRDTVAAEEEAAAASLQPDSIQPGGRARGIILAAAWCAFVIMLAGAGLSAIHFREQTVKILPQAVKVYDAIGFPVEKRTFAFDQVAYEWTGPDDRSALRLSGQIVNRSMRTRAVPPIRIVLRDQAGDAMLRAVRTIKAQPLGAGERSSFEIKLDALFAMPSAIELEFAYERMPAGDSSKTARSGE